jgi:hypothetical protein
MIELALASGQPLRDLYDPEVWTNRDLVTLHDLLRKGRS